MDQHGLDELNFIIQFRIGNGSLITEAAFRYESDAKKYFINECLTSQYTFRIVNNKGEDITEKVL